MVSRKTFIDTSAFYCAFRPEDPLHQTVDTFLRDPSRAFYTTDWVIGETVNLLTARRKPHLGRKLLGEMGAVSSLDIIYSDREYFDQAKALLLQYEDQNLPFTDCVSFVVMRSLKIHDALTTDRHFRVMGFEVLL
jgi:hypothetical protein